MFDTGEQCGGLVLEACQTFLGTEKGLLCWSAWTLQSFLVAGERADLFTVAVVLGFPLIRTVFLAWLLLMSRKLKKLEHFRLLRVLFCVSEPGEAFTVHK